MSQASNPSGKEEAVGMKELLASGDYTNIPKVGEVIKGNIISISKSEVRIDIGGITTGVIRGRELFDESSEYSDLKVGSPVEATVMELENERGEMELSFRHSGHQKAWEGLAELMKSKQIVSVVITDANKGGLMIKVGQISGFLPVSQLSPEHYPRVPGGDKIKILERLKEYVGNKFEVKIIDANEGEEKLIVSEKTAWEEKQHDVIAKHKVGEQIVGTVTAVTDFGVFVEFGEHLEGLIHISELAWQRIENPRDIVKEGDQIQAEIIAMEGSKIFLSSKKLKKDPWDKIDEKYKSGQIVKGKVLKINPFGLFVELDPEIHGLAHISELSDSPVADISKIVKIGDILDFKILSIEPKNHRLGLTLKTSSAAPAKPEKKADAPIAAPAETSPAEDAPAKAEAKPAKTPKKKAKKAE